MADQIKIRAVCCILHLVNPLGTARFTGKILGNWIVLQLQDFHPLEDNCERSADHEALRSRSGMARVISVDNPTVEDYGGN